jgi:hypothetical protein
MRNRPLKETFGKAAWRSCMALAVLSGLAIAGPAATDVTVNVVDDNNQLITNGFRWLLEEDNSYGIKKTAPDGPWAGPAGAPTAFQLPGQQSPSANYVAGGSNPSHTLSVNIHHSHAPVVCSGDTKEP